MYDLVQAVIRSGISNSTHFKVLIAIADCINSESLEWSISFAELQRLSWCARQQMFDAIKSLEQQGILIITRKKDPCNPKRALPNIYSINAKKLLELYPNPSKSITPSMNPNLGMNSDIGMNPNLGMKTNQPLVRNQTNPSDEIGLDISKDKEFINRSSIERVERDLFSQSDFPTGNNSKNGTTQNQNNGIPTKNEGISKNVDTPKTRKTSRKKKATPFPWGDEFPDELQDLKNNPKYATLLIEDEYECFKNYYLSHGKTMADWRHAFMSWLSKALKYQKERVLTKAQQNSRKKPQKDNFNAPGFYDGAFDENGDFL